MNTKLLRSSHTPQMNKLFFRSALIIASLLVFSNCAKEDEPQPEDPENPVITAGQFTWKPGSAASVTADSAYYYSQFTTIYAFKNGYANMIEVNLSSLTAASYSLSSATGNALTFITASTTHTASSGSFNITAAANNKLSGNFSANLAGGSVTSITGSFTDIPKR